MIASIFKKELYSEDKAVRSPETSTLTYQTTRRHIRLDLTK